MHLDLSPSPSFFYAFAELPRTPYRTDNKEMKATTRNAVFLICLLTLPAMSFPLHATASAGAASSASSLHVIIDPGHGGIDTGASRGAIRESMIALAVAREVASLLRDDPRFRVTLTRETDKALSLPERAHIARHTQADVFVSIHANASEDPRASGVEFWFQNQLPADEESLFLANRENQSFDNEAESQKPTTDDRLSRQSDVIRILDDLRRAYRITASSELSRILLINWHSESRHRHRNAIRQAPFYLVSEIPIPSVLVELGFVTHEKEGPRLMDANVQKTMARNLYNGLVHFKQRFDRDRNRQ